MAPHTRENLFSSLAKGDPISAAILRSPEVDKPDPSSKYSRKARHKTRPDKHEYKGEEKAKRHQIKMSKGCSKHRSSRKKSGVLLNQEFQAPNVDTERLTLNMHVPGLFNNGKSSAPVMHRDVPDLTFSEMKFLQKKRDLDHARLRSLGEYTNPRKIAKGSAQDISPFFAEINRKTALEREPTKEHQSRQSLSPSDFDVIHETRSISRITDSQFRKDARHASTPLRDCQTSAEENPLHSDPNKNYRPQTRNLAGEMSRRRCTAQEQFPRSRSQLSRVELDNQEHSHVPGLQAHAECFATELNQHDGQRDIADTIRPRSSISNDKPGKQHGVQSPRLVSGISYPTTKPQKTLYSLEDLQLLAELVEQRDWMGYEQMVIAHEQSGTRHNSMRPDRRRTEIPFVPTPIPCGRLLEAVHDSGHNINEAIHEKNPGWQSRDQRQGSADQKRSSARGPEADVRVGSDPQHLYSLYNNSSGPETTGLFDHKLHHLSRATSAGCNHNKLEFSSGMEHDVYRSIRNQPANQLNTGASGLGLDEFDIELLYLDQPCDAIQPAKGVEQNSIDLAEQELQANQQIVSTTSGNTIEAKATRTEQGLELGGDLQVRPQLLRPSANSVSALEPYTGLSRPWILY